MTDFRCQFEITETLLEEEHVVLSAEEHFNDVNSLIEMIDVALYSYDTENFKFDLTENQSTSETNDEEIDVGVTITIYLDDDSTILLKIPFDFDEMSLNFDEITVEGDPNNSIARILFNHYNHKNTL